MRAAVHLVVLFVLVGRLPLLGAWSKGLPLSAFEDVLARPGFVRHAPFSWPFFALASLAVVAVVAPFAVHFSRFGPVAPAPRPRRPLPWWGWLGAAGIAASWFFAWTRLDWFAPVQEHTFTPLWLGYVLLVNAWAERRSGSCLLRRRVFAVLVAVSAVFWWFFEYLNRFVESWEYHGATLDGPLAHVLHGTLPFATVLPAVMSTQDLLATFPRLVTPFASLAPMPFVSSRRLGALLLAAAVSGLALLSVAPSWLFPLPWLAPLLLLVGLSSVSGERHVLSDVARGDWRLVVTLALAALVCGFFWEMWNYASAARWTYTIPFVDRFHVFEMPLLGYAGYLPFGLECGAVAALLGWDGRQRLEARAPEPSCARHPHALAERL